MEERKYGGYFDEKKKGESSVLFDFCGMDLRIEAGTLELQGFYNNFGLIEIEHNKRAITVCFSSSSLYYPSSSYSSPLIPRHELNRTYVLCIPTPSQPLSSSLSLSHTSLILRSSKISISPSTNPNPLVLTIQDVCTSSL